MRTAKYDLLIIDYLQLLIADDRYRGNRQAEVGFISSQLKAIAMDYQIPVIALSQLNRASEGRQNKEPTMGELREAGNLEQDASTIILMWNKNENDPSEKGLKVEKSRQGKTGRCDMVFDGAHMTFKPECEKTPFDGR
jgi:replicative DNA helicase